MKKETPGKRELLRSIGLVCGILFLMSVLHFIQL